MEIIIKVLSWCQHVSVGAQELYAITLYLSSLEEFEQKKHQLSDWNLIKIIDKVNIRNSKV